MPVTCDLVTNPSKINTSVSKIGKFQLFKWTLPISDCDQKWHAHFQRTSLWELFIHSPSTCSGRILQHNLCGISLQFNWVRSQCLPHTPPYLSALLLVWDALLCLGYVQHLSNLHSCKPYKNQVLWTGVQVPHQGTFSNSFEWCILCREGFQLWWFRGLAYACCGMTEFVSIELCIRNHENLIALWILPHSHFR